MDFYSNLMELISGSRNFASVNHVRITKLEPGYCEAELEVAPESLNFMGNIHGGCLATLADTCAGGASRTLGKSCVTLSSNMNYLAPGAGSRIRAQGRVVKGGKTIVVTDVILLDDQDVKVASATFTFFLKDAPILPPEA